MLGPDAVCGAAPLAVDEAVKASGGTEAAGRQQNAITLWTTKLAVQVQVPVTSPCIALNLLCVTLHAMQGAAAIVGCYMALREADIDLLPDEDLLMGLPPQLRNSIVTSCKVDFAIDIMKYDFNMIMSLHDIAVS